jgi:FkbM family methyltransferase
MPKRPKRFRLTLHEGSSGRQLREAPLGYFAPMAVQKLIIEFNRRFGLGNGALRKYGCSLVELSREGPIDYDYFGFRIRFFPPLRQSARMLFSPGWCERKERAFIAAHLPPRGVFIDIGANVGFYTFFVAASCPSCTVISVEPIHEYTALLNFNIRINGLERVTVEEVALSDRARVAEFDRETESMNFGTGEVSVRTETLQHLAMSRAIHKIDCMKIDVEGVEDLVLMPFFRSAARSLWPKAIVIEHACRLSWKEDCLVFAKANGYREKMQTALNTGLVLGD